VKFIKTHVGHEDELRTKRLSQKEQTLIVEQLQKKILRKIYVLRNLQQVK
jgi:hypothetical protein